LAESARVRGFNAGVLVVDGVGVDIVALLGRLDELDALERGVGVDDGVVANVVELDGVVDVVDVVDVVAVVALRLAEVLVVAVRVVVGVDGTIVAELASFARRGRLLSRESERPC